MSLSKHAVCAFLVILLLATAPAVAQEGRPPHVRPERGMQRLVDEAARRSPAIREWIDRLEELDVTVYIRVKLFVQIDLEGRVALLSSAGSRRYLVIELACGRSELTQMATLGHELFHAIEIAEEPSAVNADTLAGLYSRIGIQTGDSRGATDVRNRSGGRGRTARAPQLLTSTRHGHGT